MKYELITIRETIEQKYLSMISYRLYNPFVLVLKVLVVHISIRITIDGQIQYLFS